MSIFVVSCSRDNDEGSKSTESTVEVKVLKNGALQKGVTVYMFKNENVVTQTFEPLFASKSAVTSDNGVATFKLQEVYDLDAVSSQTTLHFGVFENRTLLGKTSVTAEKGKKHSVTISY